MVTPQEYLNDVVNGVPVVKVGMHGKQSLSRIKAYGSSARIHQIRTVNKGRGAERVIIALFRARFGDPIYGKEYFRCKVEHATEAFDDCIKILSSRVKEEDKKIEISVVAPLPVDETVYVCKKKPNKFTFCCKTFCHKLCYLHFLHEKWDTNDDLKLVCFFCLKWYEKRKVFFAKKIMSIEPTRADSDGEEIDGDPRPEDMAIVNMLQTEIVKNGVVGLNSEWVVDEDIYNNTNSKCLNLEGYKKWFYEDLRVRNDIATKCKYVVHKTHMICGPYRFGGFSGNHGQFTADKHSISFPKDLYKNQIQKDTYMILIIDKNATCYGSLFDAGIAIGKGAKVVILFEDGIKFPNPEENKEFNYKEFNYIFTYNYEITENERDMITLIPYLREKFYTYEDYLASLKYYKAKMTWA